MREPIRPRPPGRTVTLLDLYESGKTPLRDILAAVADVPVDEVSVVRERGYYDDPDDVLLVRSVPPTVDELVQYKHDLLAYDELMAQWRLEQAELRVREAARKLEEMRNRTPATVVDMLAALRAGPVTVELDVLPCHEEGPHDQD